MPARSLTLHEREEIRGDVGSRRHVEVVAVRTVVNGIGASASGGGRIAAAASRICRISCCVEWPWRAARSRSAVTTGSGTLRRCVR